MITSLARKSLDLLYPMPCGLCGTPVVNKLGLCNSCEKKLFRLESPFCDTCGEPYDGVIDEEFSCPNCSGQEVDFEFAVSSLKNSNGALELVHLLKYRSQYHLVPLMADLMVERFQEESRFRGSEWLVVPVPLHWRRKMSRGFNQAEELARVFADSLNLPMNMSLKRAKSTETQTALGRKKRQNNLKGSFYVKDSAGRSREKNVLLIDDVLTTGSTAHECAQTLKKTGVARRVAVLTFMRG